MENMTVRITSQQEELLELIARNLRASRSFFVRSLIDNHAEELYRKLLPFAELQRSSLESNEQLLKELSDPSPRLGIPRPKKQHQPPQN